ncbi:MAG: hypothetical protein KGY80_04500 [Candidatus Thorarchaeota archaeon]|nr:hypothetical protein [Candidatus Thorarchaeota archaeon]
MEYAQALVKDGKSSVARKHVKEAISIYEKQLQKWNSDSIRAELETAKELLKQIEECE